MKSPTEFAPLPPPRSAYRVYQGLTIVAMIVLLGTLWAF